MVYYPPVAPSCVLTLSVCPHSQVLVPLLPVVGTATATARETATVTATAIATPTATATRTATVTFTVAATATLHASRTAAANGTGSHEQSSRHPCMHASVTRGEAGSMRLSCCSPCSPVGKLQKRQRTPSIVCRRVSTRCCVACARACCGRYTERESRPSGHGPRDVTPPRDRTPERKPGRDETPDVALPSPSTMPGATKKLNIKIGAATNGRAFPTREGVSVCVCVCCCCC